MQGIVALQAKDHPGRSGSADDDGERSGPDKMYLANDLSQPKRTPEKAPYSLEQIERHPTEVLQNVHASIPEPFDGIIMHTLYILMKAVAPGTGKIGSDRLSDEMPAHGFHFQAAAEYNSTQQNKNIVTRCQYLEKI
jgi:hypothetical protein